MSLFGRVKNRCIARLTTRFPKLAKRMTDSYIGVEMEDIPWAPVRRPLKECKVALVTTAGVHQRDQTPFDMQDPDGDPSFRTIEGSRQSADLMITHDYYDHSDADRDINIVFPMERLEELAGEGFVGGTADRHFGFMGHITGPHIRALIEQTAPDVAERLKSDGVDVVVLTPG